MKRISNQKSIERLVISTVYSIEVQLFVLIKFGVQSICIITLR